MTSYFFSIPREVRPRTAEQGPLWGCDPVAGCLRTGTNAGSPEAIFATSDQFERTIDLPKQAP
jgi:hypothetical protein